MITSTMSRVEEFLIKAKQDVRLGQQLAAIDTNDKRQAINQIVKIAGKAGYKFSAKEYEEFARAHCCQKLNTTDVCDQDLLGVACRTS